MSSEILVWILAFTIFGSVASLVGGAALLVRERWTKRKSIYFVSFAAGALLGTVFLEFLPEIVSTATNTTFIYMLGGIVVFFLLENILSWHHHHTHHGEKEVHTFNYMITIGDSIHNFVDGIAIAIAFLVSIPIGITTAIAVFFHEVPQEIGDFAVLLRGGWSKSKVMFYNLLSAVVAIIGALIAFYWAGSSAAITSDVLAFIAGMFLYIAGVDLIPEMYHRHHGAGNEKKTIQKTILYAAILILGILVIYGVTVLFPE